MKKLKLLLLINFLSILICSVSFSQDSLYLKSLLEFTSNEKFIAEDAYKIFSMYHSTDESINLTVEGNISTGNFSFALISMLPRLKKTSLENVEVNLVYTDLNEENFKEARIIEAVKFLYPDKFMDYLLNRSIFSFENEWEETAINMSMDVNLIKIHISDSRSMATALDKFNSELNSFDYRVFINGSEFNLLPLFFRGFSEFGGGFDGVCCDRMKCLADCIYDVIELQVANGTIANIDELSEAKKSEYLNTASSPQAVLTTLISYLSSSYGAVAQGFSNPVADLALINSLVSAGLTFIPQASTAESRCINACNVNACNFEEDGPILDCPEGSICHPLQRVYYTSPGGIIPTATFSEYLTCRKCPTQIPNSTELENSQNLQFNWKLDIDNNNTPQFGSNNYEQISAILYGDRYHFMEIFNTEIFLTINGGDPRSQFLMGNGYAESGELTFYDVLKSYPDLGVGDYVCVTSLGTHQNVVGSNCAEEVCWTIKCPNISLVEENGELFLEVEDYYAFQWPGQMSASVSGFDDLVLIDRNGRIKVGDITGLGCYSLILSHSQNVNSSNDNLGSLANECLVSSDPPLCINDLCDLKENIT